MLPRMSALIATKGASNRKIGAEFFRKIGEWRWKIYPKMEIGPKETSEATFGSRDAAIAACIIEIDNGLDGKDDAPRS